MYESFWKLSSKPFSHRTETSQFYRSRSHHQALLRLKYSLESFPGPGLVIGLSGTGKSSLARIFAAENSAHRPFVHVAFPALNRDELLRWIGTELCGTLDSDSAGAEAILRQIQRSLRKSTQLGQRPLLCIDDAHLLSDDALQYIVQPLLNMSESDDATHLSVLLMGLPSLASRLRKVGELNERVAVTTALTGFTETETREYILGCLKQAGGAETIFSAGALQRVFEITAGNPRRINRLCDMALLVGYAEQLAQISELQIDGVGAELVPAAA